MLCLHHSLLCLQGSYGGDAEIVGLEWYHGQEGYCQPGCPVLAVCLCTGQLQLMTDELDDSCLLVNTGMQVSSIKWNSNGSVLAVSGTIASNGSPAAAVVQFYSCYGEDAFTVAVLHLKRLVLRLHTAVLTVTWDYSYGKHSLSSCVSSQCLSGKVCVYDDACSHAGSMLGNLGSARVSCRSVTQASYQHPELVGAV